jgi:hypothetical protein
MSPVGDRDPSESPPPSPPPTHVKGRGKRQDPPPPPLPPKKQKKPKQKKPPPTLAYEKTNKELDQSVKQELDRQIFKVKEPPVEKPIDRVKFHHFMRKMEEETRKKLDDIPKPLTDYDRQVLNTQCIKKKTASSFPQLGTQSKQSIPDLKVLSTYEKQVSEFNKDETGLTKAQIRGDDAIPTQQGTYRVTIPLTTFEQQLHDFAKSVGLTPAQLLGDEEIAPHKGANRPKYVPGCELVRL